MSEIAPYSDEYFMKMALRQAEQAFDKDEVPVGAVIVCRNQIVARAHNLTETLNDPTAHAEMQAITSATSTLGGKHLDECTMYVTLEPCVMCAGASYWSQVGKIVFGAYDQKRGVGRISESILHPKTAIVGGIMEAECGQLLKDFFIKKRNTN